MINAAHAIVYAEDADKARAFFRDVLDFPAIDVGGGWLVFGLPRTELAAHPTGPDVAGGHELFFLCDDVEKTVADLTAKGAEFDGEIVDRGWGLYVTMRVPGAGTMGLYQPRHPTA